MTRKIKTCASKKPAGDSMTDDDEERIERIMERVLVRVLETYGMEKPASAAALRMRRMREQKRNKAENKSVTRKGQGRNKGVTEPRTLPTVETWGAYSGAYLQRWGVEPVRNAAVNGQLAQFVGRLGATEAPLVAAFFLRSNRGLYVSAKHPVTLLLRNAESLRTEWATGNAGTEAEARQADQTQARGNVFGKLIQEVRNESK